MQRFWTKIKQFFCRPHHWEYVEDGFQLPGIDNWRCTKCRKWGPDPRTIEEINKYRQKLFDELSAIFDKNPELAESARLRLGVTNEAGEPK